MRSQDKRADLIAKAAGMGLTVRMWRPRDGCGIRYRVFSYPADSWFSDDPMFSCLGMSDLAVWMRGYWQGFVKGSEGEAEFEKAPWAEDD